MPSPDRAAVRWYHDDCRPGHRAQRLNKHFDGQITTLWRAVLRRVLAARDRDAVQKLYWGVTADERFMVRLQCCQTRPVAV